jgi:hypothetical protein
MFTPKKVLPALAVAALVAGCATPPYNMEGYRAIDDADGLPVLQTDAFKSVKPARAMYAEMAIREDYVRYEKDGARAEIYYINPRNGFRRHIALNHPYDSSTVFKLFNYLTSRKAEFTKGERARNDLTEFWYRIATLPTEGRQCVVFNAEWDLHHQDPLTRPDKVMFGYFCPKPGVNVDKALAGTVIKGLGVRDINVQFTGKTLEIGGPATQPVQSELARLAQGGGTNGDWGAASFPFDMAVYYSPSGPRDFDD